LKRHASNDLRPVLLSGSSHPALAQKIADSLGWSLGERVIDRFPDGEIKLQIVDQVRGRDVFVVQSIALKPNHYLMELLVMVDALKRASAKSITAVIPYFGYCRQDRKDRPRAPITAKLVANLIEKAGVTHVLTMDLHADQVQGFFDIPVDNLKGRIVLSPILQESGLLKEGIVVGPDVGSIKVARSFAQDLGLGFVIVDKQRGGEGTISVAQVIGEVAGKDVLLADDVCSTAGTLVSAAQACRGKGARRIMAAVTHGLFVGDAIHKIEAGVIDRVFYCDTIQETERLASATKLHQVSVAPLFACAIQRLLASESISSLMER